MILNNETAKNVLNDFAIKFAKSFSFVAVPDFIVSMLSTSFIAPNKLKSFSSAYS